MTFSLNEIESTAKKATRGAGYPWGLAEEAAKATRWLSAQGQAGCAILLEALRRFDGVPLAPHRPDVAQTEWRAAEGVMCPLAAGSALADRAKVLNSKDIHLENLCAPALILPFAASTAAVLGQPVSVRWEGGAATVSATQLSL